MANDYGHEPWARAAVACGAALTVEQGAELLTSLDKARREAENLRGILRALGYGDEKD